MYRIFSSILILALLIHFTRPFFYRPELRLCDGTMLKKYKKNFCPSKLVFTSNFTKVNSDCICITGVWLLLNRDCVPSVIAAKGGCIRAPQIKALQHMGTFGKNDFFAIASKSRSLADFELLRPVKSLNANGYLWLFNGVLNRSEDGVYCAQKSPRSEQKVKGYKVLERYELNGRLTVQFECLGNYKLKVKPELEYGITSVKNSECKINCNEIPRSRLLVKSQPELEGEKRVFVLSIRNKTTWAMSKLLPHVGHVSGKKKRKGSAKTGKQPDPKPTVSYKSRSHEFLGNHLNDNLKRKILGLAFPQNEGENQDRFPKVTFRILEATFRIARKVCGGIISKRFMKYGSILFKAIYMNRGTHLLERLSEAEGDEIMKFLTKCYGQARPLDWDHNAWNSLVCKDKVKAVKENGVWTKLNRTDLRTVLLEERHLTLEIPWNIIDLTVGACIDAFAKSYILYHKMEQALERLFVRDLKILWRLPPLNEQLYRRLYGPNWERYAENLEKCVQATYARNAKLSRLRRPDESISGGVKGKLKSFRATEDGAAISSSKFSSPVHFPPLLHTKRQLKATKDGKIILESVHLSCQNYDFQQCVSNGG